MKEKNAIELKENEKRNSFVWIRIIRMMNKARSNERENSDHINARWCAPERHKQVNFSCVFYV